MVRMALLLLAAVTAFYWKIVFTRQYDWGWGPDFATQVMPWLNTQARQWHQGIFPLWDPSLWTGQPLLGQAQPGAAYPLNWILFLLPLSEHGAIRTGYLQWYLVAIHWMAAGFAYWFCRDLGRSRTAATLAGLGFSFSGYLGTTNWPQMINGAVWAPLVLMFLFRSLRGEHSLANAALSGLALGLSWLSGHHQIPLFISFAAGGVWLAGCWQRWSRIRFAAVAVLIAGLTGAIQILPAREYGKSALRWVGESEALGWDQPVPYSVHEKLSVPANRIVAIVLPMRHHNVDPFVGVALFTLALTGVALCWRTSPVPPLTLLAVAAWFYSLGGHSLLEGGFYGLVPMAEKARTPGAALNLFTLGVAVLAAFGLDALRDQSGSAWLRRTALTLTVAGLVFALVTQFAAPAWADPGPAWRCSPCGPPRWRSTIVRQLLSCSSC